MSMKKSSDTIGSRTRDLPTCSVVPQPTAPLRAPHNNNKKTYNFYLVIEVPDHVYVFYAYRLYFADKDIYMIRYFYHKIEIVRVFYY